MSNEQTKDNKIEKKIEEKKSTDEAPREEEMNELYKKLSAPIPEKYLVTYIKDGKTFKGYHAQYAINLLNEVIGLGNWYVESQIIKEEIVNKGLMVAMEITIIIDNFHIRVEGSGGAHARDIANVYKGARTSAFKNACKYLGIGNELYLQNDLDDDIVINETEKKEEVPESLKELSDLIEKAGSMESLKLFEPKIKEIKDKKDQTIIFKQYNSKKIALMSK